jgi:sarcosine oxidase, subunit gamma
MADTLVRARPDEAAVSFRYLPRCTRQVLRGRPAAIMAAGATYGMAMPAEACRAAACGERAALWLGPDEWLLLLPEDEADDVLAALGKALAGQPHSLVDIGHRNRAIEIAGPAAAVVLNAACPLDLDLQAFPVGMCTRTLLGKAEIVLWRAAEERFRAEISRSLSDYTWQLLHEARRGLAAGAER